jgi:hypothetical protein
MIPTPKAHNGDFANPPSALKPLFLERRWVNWKWVEGKNGKWTKPPFQSEHPESYAANDKSETWDSSSAAIKTVLAGRANGIGFALTGSSYCAVDMDHCRDPATGKIDAWAQEIINRAPSAYVEVTVSGTGLRIIGVGSGQAAHRKFSIPNTLNGAGVEVYRKATRYVTISCLQIGACDKLTNIDELIYFIITQYERYGAERQQQQEQKPEQAAPPSDAPPLINGHGDIDNLIRSGTAIGHRSEAFARVVWSLAGTGHTPEEIETKLRQFPNGIASKFLAPRDRLRTEIDRCYGKRELEASPQSSAAGSENQQEPASDKTLSTDDFYCYMPLPNSYIFIHTGETWPATSVNARVPSIIIAEGRGPDDDPVEMKASTWLAKHRPVEQMTWAPGLPALIKNRVISGGGWRDRSGSDCFNLYRPPVIKPGDATKADPWVRHVKKVFPDDIAHIIHYLAQRVQRPGEKINHALVLGGDQGIGKDTLLEPAKEAVGPWNWREISPQALLGQFNSFARSAVLRVNEACDLGDLNRYQFYEHMKTYTATPPDVLRVNEKFLRDYDVLNCTGVIITTNHKTGGMYLPPSTTLADFYRHGIPKSFFL